MHNGTAIICHVSKKYRKYRTFLKKYRNLQDNQKIQETQDALYALSCVYSDHFSKYHYDMFRCDIMT